MKLNGFTGFLCLCTLAMAQDVNFDYDRSANFNAFKTYQWVDLTAARAPSQLMDQNIKRAVDAQLSMKGMQRVETGGDVHVAYQAAVDQEKQFEAWGAGPRYYGARRVTSSTIEVGKLVVDFYDPAKKQLVWRGSMSKTLDIKKDPEKNFQNLQKAVAKLFKNYPPASGK